LLTISQIISPTLNLNEDIQKDPLNLGNILLNYNNLMDALKTPNSACNLKQKKFQQDICYY